MGMKIVKAWVRDGLDGMADGEGLDGVERVETAQRVTKEDRVERDMTESDGAGRRGTGRGGKGRDGTERDGT